MKQSSNIGAGGSALFILVSGIVILLAVVFFCTKLANNGPFGDVAATTGSTTQTRIQPVGQVTMSDGVTVGERKGDQVFNEIYIQCHAADSIALNAPKSDNRDNQTPRVAQGFDTLLQHALNGLNATPVKGSAADLIDQELKRVIIHMTNRDGVSFPDPDATASADAAASSAAPTTASAVTDGTISAALAVANATKAEDKGVAAPASGGADGKKVHEVGCQACHGDAIPSIPHVGKEGGWTPRVKQGRDTLHKHAFKGSNAMSAKGSNSGLSDDEVKAAVGYMADQSGAKF